MIKRQTFYNQKLAELHVHIRGATPSAIMWSIAHEQGIRLPTKDFWQFNKMITIAEKKLSWKKLHELCHWGDLIQSSTEAMEDCTYHVIGGAYRTCNITLLELSYNPMLRCRDGEKDMDHIIVSSIHGMDKALLEYPQVKAGLIFLLDRRLSPDKNEIIVQKAIKYKNRGVVGIDLSGPEPEDHKFYMKDLKSCFTLARKSGLGTCVHAGEHKGCKDIEEALEYLDPDRIIHGTHAYENKKLLHDLKERGKIIAVCPTANLKNGFLKSINELKEFMNALKKAKVKFCINTDNPEMIDTNLLKEFRLLLENKILTREEILKANKTAFESTFIK